MAVKLKVKIRRPRDRGNGSVRRGRERVTALLKDQVNGWRENWPPSFSKTAAMLPCASNSASAIETPRAIAILQNDLTRLEKNLALANEDLQRERKHKEHVEVISEAFSSSFGAMHRATEQHAETSSIRKEQFEQLHTNALDQQRCKVEKWIACCHKYEALNKNLREAITERGSQDGSSINAELYHQLALKRRTRRDLEEMNAEMATEIAQLQQEKHSK